MTMREGLRVQLAANENSRVHHNGNRLGLFASTDRPFFVRSDIKRRNMHKNSVVHVHSQ